MTLPLSPAENFIAAILDGDAANAQKSSTPESWGAREGSPRDLYEQATRKGFTLTLSGESRLSNGRAAFECTLTHKESGRALGSLWLLLLRDDQQAWCIDGIIRGGGVLDAFILGKIPARFAIEDLPSMPEAQTWGEGVLAALEENFQKAVSIYAVGSEGRRQILWRLGAALRDANAAALAITHGSEALGRAQLGFEFDTGEYSDQIWVTIHQTKQGWKLLSASSISSAEALLAPLLN